MGTYKYGALALTFSITFQCLKISVSVPTKYYSSNLFTFQKVGSPKFVCGALLGHLNCLNTAKSGSESFIQYTCCHLLYTDLTTYSIMYSMYFTKVSKKGHSSIYMPSSFRMQIMYQRHNHTDYNCPLYRM